MTLVILVCAVALVQQDYSEQAQHLEKSVMNKLNRRARELTALIEGADR